MPRSGTSVRRATRPAMSTPNSSVGAPSREQDGPDRRDEQLAEGRQPLQGLALEGGPEPGRAQELGQARVARRRGGRCGRRHGHLRGQGTRRASRTHGVPASIIEPWRQGPTAVPLDPDRPLPMVRLRAVRHGQSGPPTAAPRTRVRDACSERGRPGRPAPCEGAQQYEEDPDGLRRRRAGSQGPGHGGELAKKFDATLTVVSVVPVHPGRTPIDPWDDREVHQQELLEAAKALRELGIEPELARVVRRSGQDHRADRRGRAVDAIMSGSRDLGSIERALQGSVSEHVATHAVTTVIVAR